MISKTLAHRPSSLFRGLLFAAAFFASLFVSAQAQVKSNDASSVIKAFDISSGDAMGTLKQFMSQADTKILYSVDAVKGVKTNAVKGDLSPRAALDRMLEGTGLYITQNERDGALAVSKNDPKDQRLAQKNSRQPNQRDDVTEEGVVKLDTFEVMGSKLLNMDIPRTRDDPQPYIVFDRDQLHQSGATNLDQFLKQRLTANTQYQSNDATFLGGGTSSINLRGLGTDQTLILVDGRRVPSIFSSSSFLQPDLNGISLAAVERIEVLPTTASGIYGGSATGGVINIVLRRDYKGAEVSLTYDNTFQADSALRKVDLNVGLNLEGGKTNVLFTGSYAVQNVLALEDRDFVQRGRVRAVANIGYLQAFGSLPPLGATTNIRSTNGANLTLKNSNVSLNSPITYVPVGYSGISSDGGAGLVADAGKYNLALADSLQPDGGGRSSLLNAPLVQSLSATIRRQFSSRLQAFLDLGISKNSSRFAVTNGDVSTTRTLSASAASNPFNQDIYVRVPISTISGQETRITNNVSHASTGIILKLPREFIIEADYSWNQSYADSRTPYQGFSRLVGDIDNGTINVVRDTNAFPINLSSYNDQDYYLYRSPANRDTLQDATLRFAGKLVALPGGAMTLAGNVENQHEKIGAGQDVSTQLGSTPVFYPAISRTVDSAYVEIRAPVVSPRNGVKLVHSLEVQLSGRIDDYTSHTTLRFPATPTSLLSYVKSNFRSTNPTLALHWEPTKDFAIRVSYGTGFLPPSLLQLSPPQSTADLIPNFLRFLRLTDPLRGNTPVTTGDRYAAGNPNLRPEKSTSWSTGLIATPRGLPGLRVSVDYSRIRKTDNIAGVPYRSFQELLSIYENKIPGLVARGPNLPSDQPGWAGPITAIYDVPYNFARTAVDAYDIQLNYDCGEEHTGKLGLFAVATYQTHFQSQIFEGQPILERVGLQDGPLKFKASAGATWTRSNWTLGWNCRYYDAYHVYTSQSSDAAIASNIALQGSATVGSQTYHDLFFSYRFNSAKHLPQGVSRWLIGTEITMGVKNIFNVSPPLDLTSQSVYSYYGDPRMASYWFNVKKNF